MFSAEGIGKNIEKAIENALLELKATREDVDIKILSEGGLFKKAKVLVTISEDAREKYEKKYNKRAEEEKKEIVKEEQEETKVTKENPKKEAKAKQEPIEKKETELTTVAEEDESSRQDKIVDPCEFLKGLFEVAGKEITITRDEDERYIHINVEGEDLGDMIGHRGDCFYAISRLVTALAGKQSKKILLDIGGYKEKRAESLTALAKRTAAKVAKSGRYIKLQPMNPSDRRIIHTALQDDNRVTTLSKGTEPHRYVIVFPKNED